MKKKKTIAKNSEETKKFARSFIEHLIKKGPAKKGATIVGLYGDLGAGKTFFTKEAAKILDVKGSVASPTFVLERIYKLSSKNKFEHLIHIDAYRLEGGDELTRLGWEELVNNNKNLIFIEWPEKVFDVMPESHIGIFFEHAGIEERKIEIKNLKI